MRIPGENEGDIRKDEYDKLPEKEKKNYSMMVFDEDFVRGGYEDVSLFLRARDTFGMKIIMSSFACYWHKQGATRWNSEKIGTVNDFGRQSKSIEQENLQKFINKWGFNPHAKPIWHNNEIFNA